MLRALRLEKETCELASAVSVSRLESRSLLLVDCKVYLRMVGTGAPQTVPKLAVEAVAWMHLRIFNTEDSEERDCLP